MPVHRGEGNRIMGNKMGRKDLKRKIIEEEGGVTMKTIEYEYEISKEYELNHYFKRMEKDSEFLFFDIETTGFVAKNTTLYLIGALYYKENKIHVIQWFNEDGYCEKDLISSFCEFTKEFSYLVHFNGNGFDLPYLCQKAEILHLPFDLKETIVQIDLLKEAKPLKVKNP